MIVEEGMEEDVLAYFEDKSFISLDTETYGLGWDDKMFSLIIGDDKNQFYFNFFDGEDHLGNKSPVILNELKTLIRLQSLFNREDLCWFLHNAKFDLRRLNIAGLWITGPIHDTEVFARIIRNDHLKYSLAACAEREGLKKDDLVEKYISEHKLYEWVTLPGKSKREKNKQFYKVPFEIISQYAMTDVEVTFKLGMGQVNALAHIQ